MRELLSDILFRIRALVFRHEADRELQDELSFHLSMDAAQLEQKGLTREEARQQAKRRFGSSAIAAEQARDGWGVGVLNDLVIDGRRALRQMRRQPAFTAIAILALGLGIGASVGLMSVVNSLVLRPLPYADEERIHVITPDYSWSAQEYDFLRERLAVFETLALFSTDGMTYSTGTQPGEPASMLEVIVSSPSLFSALGVRPLLGRVYDANDDRPSAPAVVVISYTLWQQDFGGNPSAVGRRITLSGEPATIIGVMPPGFFFPAPQLRAWMPLRMETSGQHYKDSFLTLVGRARPGAGTTQVDLEIKRFASALGERFHYPASWDHSRNIASTPVHAHVVGDVRKPLFLLLGAVGLLLLIACANAAALILVRTTDRTSEMGMRRALGASAGRIARQIFAESLVLALCAAVAGAGLAAAGFGVLVSRLPLTGGLDAVTGLGGTAFVTAFVLALGIALGVSIIPMRRVLRSLDIGASRERSDRGLHRGAQVHGVIIGLQVGFAVLLVVGAMLLIRSVDRIRSVDLGIDPTGVTAFNVQTEEGIPRPVRAQMYESLVRRISAMPGVSSAGIINRLPVRDLGYELTVHVEGRSDLDGGKAPALYRPVTPGAFKSLGIQLVGGREFDSTDVVGSAQVAIINEGFAQQAWPGQDPLGKHLSEGWSGTQTPRVVVGVIRDVRLRGPMAKTPATLWIPFAQAGSGQNSTVLVVKSAVPAASIVTSVRHAVAAADSRFAIGRTQTMPDALETSLATPLQLRFFFMVFGALALLLGAIGVFGLVSYAVARRRAEFAVRMSLGASPAMVGRQVVRIGVAPVAVGVVAGSLAAIASARLVGSFLFGVAPTDAVSFVAAAAALLGAGLLAATIPALRAGRTSPAEVLRAEA